MLAESSYQLYFLFVYFKHRFFMLCMKQFISTCLIFKALLIGWLVEALLGMVSGTGQYRSMWISEGQSLELSLIIIMDCDNVSSKSPCRGALFDFPLTVGILKQGSTQVNYFLFLLEINQICFPSHLFFSFIFISWRLISLQYCSGFCHTLT